MQMQFGTRMADMEFRFTHRKSNDFRGEFHWVAVLVDSRGNRCCRCHHRWLFPDKKEIRGGQRLSDTHTWDIEVGGTATGICQWITDQGGPSGISSIGIYALLQSFINQSTVPGYTFIPTSLELFGCIQYWNGNISGGNTSTGCSFTWHGQIME